MASFEEPDTRRANTCNYTCLMHGGHFVPRRSTGWLLTSLKKKTPKHFFGQGSSICCEPSRIHQQVRLIHLVLVVRERARLYVRLVDGGLETSKVG